VTEDNVSKLREECFGASSWRCLGVNCSRIMDRRAVSCKCGQPSSLHSSERVSAEEMQAVVARRGAAVTPESEAFASLALRARLRRQLVENEVDQEYLPSRTQGELEALLCVVDLLYQAASDETLDERDRSMARDLFASLPTFPYENAVEAHRNGTFSLEFGLGFAFFDALVSACATAVSSTLWRTLKARFIEVAPKASGEDSFDTANPMMGKSSEQRVAWSDEVAAMVPLRPRPGLVAGLADPASPAPLAALSAEAKRLHSLGRTLGTLAEAVDSGGGGGRLADAEAGLQQAMKLLVRPKDDDSAAGRILDDMLKKPLKIEASGELGEGIALLSECLSGAKHHALGEALRFLFDDDLVEVLEQRLVLALQELRDGTRRLAGEALTPPPVDVTSQLKAMAGQARRANLEELLRGVLSSKFDQDLTRLLPEAGPTIAAATIHLTLSSVLVAHAINCSREVCITQGFPMSFSAYSFKC